MGLFPSANDFKAGKGVEKDAPRKTGIGRFFELVGRDMNGMFLANLLTCIGFAPVICLVYIGFLQNSLPVMLGSAAVGGLLAGPALISSYTAHAERVVAPRGGIVQALELDLMDLLNLSDTSCIPSVVHRDMMAVLHTVYASTSPSREATSIGLTRHTGRHPMYKGGMAPISIRVVRC